MKKIFYCAVVVSVLSACGSNAGNAGSSTEVQAPSVLDTSNALSTNIQPAPALPSGSNNVALPQGNAATAALNPPHGQPGHRCDIAVGAPLNSTPTAQPMISQPASNAPAVSLPGGSSNGVRLNPPHGQPGHDCSVEVGKPLK